MLLRKGAQVPLNTWWTGDPQQRYWLEISDRDEPGENLLAPQLNGAGREEWSYSLLTETRPGDRVLHWYSAPGGGSSIFGWSEVVGPVSTGTITWQARGTRGRARGVPTTGPSWFVPLGGLHDLASPLYGSVLGVRDVEVRAVRDKLAAQHPGTLYFPFSFYRAGEVRAKQAYLTKFPVDLIDLFPELEEVRSNPDQAPPEDDAGASKKPVKGGSGRIQDPELRSAIEKRAVEVAKDHYVQLGADWIEELGKPYDLRLSLGGVERHVEVKGSSQSSVRVDLTFNEVAHAASFQPTDLVVVDGIDWKRDSSGKPVASGGQLRKWADWEPNELDLTAIAYRYSLPDGPDVGPV